MGEEIHWMPLREGSFPRIGQQVIVLNLWGSIFDVAYTGIGNGFTYSVYDEAIAWIPFPDIKIIGPIVNRFSKMVDEHSKIREEEIAKRIAAEKTLKERNAQLKALREKLKE